MALIRKITRTDEAAISGAEIVVKKLHAAYLKVPGLDPALGEGYKDRLPHD